LFKRSINITRIKKNQKLDMLDTILIESPIDIAVNSEPLVNIICLPNNLKELAIGFLFSVGIINSINDIKDIKVDEVENSVNIKLVDDSDFDVKKLEINPISRIIDTTCGIPSIWRNIIKKNLIEVKKRINSGNNIKINKNIIFSSIIKMQKHTTLFKETGGCHGAAIFNLKGDLISVKEDIGRHNAIDKVIGDILLKKISLGNIFLTSTGRLTGDRVLKAIKAQIPIVASLSAAIESGIRLAFAYGITLIGFVRGTRMNIYSYPERIVL